MATIELTPQNYQDEIHHFGLVLIDWWASWCAPCRMFGPIYERVSERYPEVRFAKVDTEQHEELAIAAEISEIPTLMAYRDGVLLLHQSGIVTEVALETVIEQALKLDMQEVRRDVERESTARAE